MPRRDCYFGVNERLRDIKVFMLRILLPGSLMLIAKLTVVGPMDLHCIPKFNV